MYTYTLMCFGYNIYIYRKRECLDENWKKTKKDLRNKLAPNIVKLIDMFNNCVKWVKWTILAEKNTKDRGYLIKKFIKIMLILYSSNNFESFFALMLSLNSNPVIRLSKSWKYVPKKYVDKFKKLRELISSKNSYKNIRAKQNQSILPILPYMGIFCSDLVSLNQITLKKKDSSLNPNNLIKTLHIINKALMFQNTPYDFQDNKLLKQYLINQFHLVSKVKDEFFYDCSINLEPKKIKKKKK